MYDADGNKLQKVVTDQSVSGKTITTTTTRQRCGFYDLKTTEIMTHKFNFSSSHHQFYICDKTSPMHTDDDDFWTDEAFDSKLAMGEGILGIGTASYSHCKGEIIVLDQAKDTAGFKQYDHVVEAGLQVPSGILSILDCLNRNVQLQIPVKPGTYRVRIYSSNFATVVDENRDDFYRIELWPSKEADRIVLKQYGE